MQCFVLSKNTKIIIINFHFFQRGEFRQATEDRHTHLYQNPWYVHHPSFLINNISDRNLLIIDELIRLFFRKPFNFIIGVL